MGLLGSDLDSGVGCFLWRVMFFSPSAGSEFLFFCAEMLASARSQHLDKLTMLLASHSTIPKSIER